MLHTTVVDVVVGIGLLLRIQLRPALIASLATALSPSAVVSAVNLIVTARPLHIAVHTPHHACIRIWQHHLSVDPLVRLKVVEPFR